uniref:G_PROTEIN_RECEP_F1_2 domain-containing protein n=1 Tax=Ascaris lumbricoides TaxID=6252 RepID=A0A0M3I176_ASCLU
MFSHVAVPTISVYLVITLIGWFGNINIVIATVRNRNLRNPCNLLIAVRSICDVVSTGANFVTAYFIYTGDYSTSLHNCMRLQFVPNVFMQFSVFHILVIGIDRVFGVSCTSRLGRLCSYLC